MTATPRVQPIDEVRQLLPQFELEPCEQLLLQQREARYAAVPDALHPAVAAQLRQLYPGGARWWLIDCETLEVLDDLAAPPAGEGGGLAA